MKIDAIITCVGEKSSKFLELITTKNKIYFDHTWILTDWKDTTTFNLTQQYELGCIATDSFYKNGAKFNRGAVFNEVFPSIENDWICLMDIDIMLPTQAGRYLLNQELNKEYLYGARRILVPSMEELKKEDKLALECPFGVGFGYFQLFNKTCSTVQKYGLHYPETNDVLEGDWIFRNRWGNMNQSLTECKDLLKELPFKLWHLGAPGNISFNHGKGFIS